MQSKLLKNMINWNFIKQDKMFLDFYEQYQKSTDDVVIYYNHKLAQDRFGSRFYFDRGLKFEKNKIYDLKGKITQEIYHLAELHRKRYVATVIPRVVKKTDTRVPHGGQGLSVYDKKYKIIWSYMNYHHFYYSDRRIMIDFNHIIISSDNKSEILYLHSLLDSKIISLILNKLVKAEKEKDILVGIKTIKEYVRIPKIIEDTQFIKNEIIKRTEEILALEERKLSDFIDFSTIMVQKYDSVSVKDCHLVVKWNNEVTKLDIRENLNLIKKVIYEKYNKKGLISDKQSINLSELKDLPVIDYEKQNQIKEYIDDLVFVLYFNISIENLGLNKAIEIKSKLLNNKYYNFIKM